MTTTNVYNQIDCHYIQIDYDHNKINYRSSQTGYPYNRIDYIQTSDEDNMLLSKNQFINTSYGSMVTASTTRDRIASAFDRITPNIITRAVSGIFSCCCCCGVSP